MKRRSILVAAFLLAPSLVCAWGFRTAQKDVTVGTAVSVGDATARTVATVENLDGTNPVYCGDSTVTSTTGHRIGPGLSFTVAGSGQEAPPAGQTIYCVATGGTVRVSVWEDLR